MKTSIVKLKAELGLIAEDHEQINSFFWGDLSRAVSEDTVQYPLMCCHTAPTGSNLQRKETVIALKIIVADKTYKDYTNLDDLESDVLQVCRDIFNTINRSPRWQKILRVLTNATAEKFIDNTKDEIAGYIITLNVAMRDSESYCNLPMGDYDFEAQPTPDTCDPALIINSTVTFSQLVNSGGTYELPDITHTDSDGTPVTLPAQTSFTCSPPVCSVPVETTKGALIGNAEPPCPFVVQDALLQNSDLTYSQGFPPNATSLLPDITHINTDGTPTLTPAQTPFVCTPAPSASGIAYQRPIYNGERTQYNLYGPKWHLDNGTYDYTGPERPVSYARQDFDNAFPFHFLQENNDFGNLAIFTDINGEYYTDPWDSGSLTDPSGFTTRIVVNHITGQALTMDAQTAATHAGALAAANSSTFGGQSWRVPTWNELNYFLCFDVDLLAPGSRYTGLEYYPFGAALQQEFWVADTCDSDTTRAYTYFAGPAADLPINLNREPKTNLLQYFMICNFYS